MQIKQTYLALAVLAGFGLALGACSSSSDDPPEMEVAEPMPEPEPHACDAGPSQACVDARAAELAALGDDATVAEANAAREALAEAQTSLAMAEAAAARAALVAAATCTAGTAECVAAHQALVDALMADDSTTVTELAEAQANLASVQSDLMATMSAEARRTMQLTLITNAIEAATTAVSGINDASSADDVANANAAVEAARTAITNAADVAEDVLATHTASVDTLAASLTTAEASWQTAQDASEALANQRAAISTAIGGAQAAVAAVNDDSTDEQVEAADDAITNARLIIASQEDVPAEEKAANNGTLDAIMANLDTAKESRMAAIEDAEEAAEEAAMARAALGKAMRAALEGPTPGTDDALDNLEATNGAVLSATGLEIDPADGRGTFDTGADHTAVTLKAGDAAGALGSWNGTMYSHSEGTGAAKVSNDAVVYTNRGTGKYLSFADAGMTVHTATSAGSDDLVGYYTVDETADLAKIMADAFTHSGTQTHTKANAKEDAVYIRGSFDGANGEYRCTGACSSTNDGKGAPSVLGGVWHFKPDAGAMVHRPDNEYLYYGWWVSKDDKGNPTAASAFAGVVEPTADALDNAGDLTRADLTGTASYVGHAAGKWAMSNALDGTGDAGHFTADAELDATFTGTNPGVTGTIDNFRLNDGDEDPDWSVSLARGGLGASGGTITAPTADATVWSINGNKAPASGTWSGTMYDEAITDPAGGPGDDGSNIPTTVTGTFYSEFSTIGRMVGAFGANKDE